MDEQLCAPRDLSEDETANLRDLLTSQLVISCDDEKEDAENLLDYAVDMIDSGENIGHVTEELKFMEMPVCDEDAAKKLGACLTKFFRGLDNGAGSSSSFLSGGEEKSDKIVQKPTPTPAPMRKTAPTPTPAPRPTPPNKPSRPSYSSSNSNSSSNTSWMSKNPVQGDAKSSSSRRQDEMKGMFSSSGGGSSVKDRMKAFNNKSTVNFDPVHFAVNQNKAEKSRRDAQKAAKESAKRFQVNSTIATKTAEEFKQLGENQKAAKKESKETAKMNSGAGVIVSIHETAPGFKKMGDDRKAAKKESKETAMKYNYNYGDGGITEEESSKFKDLSDQRKVAKSEAEEINSGFNYVYRGND